MAKYLISFPSAGCHGRGASLARVLADGGSVSLKEHERPKAAARGTRRREAFTREGFVREKSCQP
jgi:hypothetical protein